MTRHQILKRDRPWLRGRKARKLVLVDWKPRCLSIVPRFISHYVVLRLLFIGIHFTADPDEMPIRPAGLFVELHRAVFDVCIFNKIDCVEPRWKSKSLPSLRYFHSRASHMQRIELSTWNAINSTQPQVYRIFPAYVFFPMFTLCTLPCISIECNLPVRSASWICDRN